MKEPKSQPRLRWEQQFRQQRADAKWEWVEDYLARNPMGLAPRAMTATAAPPTSDKPSHQNEQMKTGKS